MYRRLISIMIFLFFIASCKKKPDIEIITQVVIEETELGKIIPLDSTSRAILNDSIAIHFYAANNNKTFWLSEYSRDKLLKLLDNVEKDGLVKEDFELEKIRNMEDSIKLLSNLDLITYDYLLTRNLIKYIQKVSSGKLDPKELYRDWDLKKNNIDYTRLLLNFQEKNGFDKAVAEARPNHIVYHSLRKALELLEEFPNDKFTTIQLEGKIELNDTADVVKEIKKRLIFWKELKPTDSLTPVFDSETEIAVKTFQIRHGLGTDGVVGAGTINALNISPEKRKQQIIANMERWRWYPRNFEDDYIILNIPDYKLHTVSKGDTTRTHKAIVGRAARKTPVLSSKVSHLVFNPTWTVPPTIKAKDIIPATAKNRNYLRQKNITVYDASGNRVSPEDWDYSKARSYRYVQSPGSSNALGLVKIMFPNKFLVYLHDTNSRSFFERENRSLSSGCVRVQNPFELSEYILDDKSKWNIDKLNDIIKQGRTKEVKVERDMYVHFLYWTAWSENEILQFRDDLYNLDADLYNKLRN